MFFICSYAGFRCLIEVSEEAMNDIMRFKNDFANYYLLEKLQEIIPGKKNYDVSIKILKKSNNILSTTFTDRIKIHSSHSKNIKYLLDGSIHTQRDAERYAFVNDHSETFEYLIDGSNTLIKVNKKEKHIDIIGDNIYHDLVYIYETLFNSFVESKGSIALHAASCSLNDKGIVICGESGSGKTTLLFDLIFKFGAKFHSNDRLIVLNDDIYNSKLFSYSVPIPVNVPIRTMRNLEAWKNAEVVKKAETDTKIRFKVSELPLLFSNEIKSKIAIDYILSVKFTMANPGIEEISIQEIINEMEILTPYDECHPKWLPIFQNENLKKDEVEKKVLKWGEKVKFLRVSGNDLISAFRKFLFQ
jgi:hypothetical protein